MPYRSEAQRRFFHAQLAQGKMKPEVVAEFDHMSKGSKLPERVGPQKPKPTKLQQARKRRFGT